MNSDIRISVDFWDHPKTIKLVRRHGLEGVRSLQCLWIWAARNRPEGFLGDDVEAIAIAARWDGEEKEFVEGLVSIGWLEDNEGRFSLHGWAEHNPWVVDGRSRSESARLSRLARECPEISRLLREYDVEGISVEEYQAYKRQGGEITAALRAYNDRTSPPTTPAPDPAPDPKKSKSHSPVNSANADSPAASGYPPEYYDFVEGFASFVLQEHGAKAPKVTPAFINSSLDTVDKLVRIDGHSFATVQAVMRWAVKDSFWAKNTLSLAGLRKKSDGLTKFQKVLAAFERSSQSNSPSEDSIEAWLLKQGEVQEVCNG